MTIKKAFEIVLGLANENVIDDPELVEQADEQNEAISKVQLFMELNEEILKEFDNG